MVPLMPMCKKCIFVNSHIAFFESDVILKPRRSQHNFLQSVVRKNNWGQININLFNRRGIRAEGADDFWYSSMRKPPQPLSPFGCKLMLI
ncbi:hypothetical protein B9Z32_00120 [Limnohabitans sp. MMS-10A-178]|nr:hypothetical protein B9Z32_00120 [Limnohabitans sp. MMS-10A-178]